MSWLAISVPVVAVAAALLGWWLNNRLGGKSLEAARRKGEALLRDARRDGEKAKQREILEARQEVASQRNKAEQDYRSRKGQIVKRERDLREQADRQRAQEADLTRQRDAFKESEIALAAREAEVGEVQARALALVEEELQALERIAGMTREEARRQLLATLKAETRYEAAAMIKEAKDEAQRNAEAEAAKIITLAIERSASDLSAERTTSQIQIPNGKDMKGRIIGHEGKNIRAFEKATGMQLLLDETGENVTFSGYNPVRREVARRVLEALVKDGNIHPKRIEDLVRRHRRRLDDEMKRAGEQTLKELGLKGVHPEMVKLLGRLKYRSSYAQNVLLHSKEVALLTGMMAAELRLDEKLARRAGLFHDIGKAIDYEREGTHPEIGAEFAGRYGEPETVVNAIASHHEDCEATSPISVLVAAADAISGARPGARRKSVAEYIKRIEQLEGLANSMQGVEQSYAIQAGREIRVIAKSSILDDARVDLLASDIAARIQTEMDYPGKIKVTVIREFRAVEYAR